jgi:hypothetical protein
VLGGASFTSAHQGGSISPLMIFTTCDASANSEAAIAKVTLVLPSPMSSMRIAGASLPTISKCGKLGIVRF